VRDGTAAATVRVASFARTALQRVDPNQSLKRFDTSRSNARKLVPFIARQKAMQKGNVDAVVSPVGEWLAANRW